MKSITRSRKASWRAWNGDSSSSIIISALLKDGLTRNLLLFAPFDFHTLSYSKNEIERNKEELVEKSRVDEDSFQYIMDIIFSKINVVEAEVITPYKEKAIEIMRDIDVNDSLFLALAFYLNCPIWSNDKHFQDQNDVKCTRQQRFWNC